MNTHHGQTNTLTDKHTEIINILLYTVQAIKILFIYPFTNKIVRITIKSHHIFWHLKTTKSTQWYNGTFTLGYYKDYILCASSSMVYVYISIYVMMLGPAQ